VSRYKNAAIRAYRERSIDAPADNVTSIFDRDTALDTTIASTLARGEPTPEGWEQELRARFRARPEVREALERMWPVLSGAELVNDLFGFRALVRSASGSLLNDDEQELLHRRRDPDVMRAPWAEADLALVDEADSLLGPVEAARPAVRRLNDGGDTFATGELVIDDLGLRVVADAATLATRFGEPSRNGYEPSVEPRTFGHVLVDEAQDLTAMQWRMLARRCPSGSMTLVGDPGQASKAGAVASWDEVLSHLPTHNATRFVSLSINYRTPAEVMEVASRLLAVAAPTVEPSRSVRSTGEYPRYVTAASDDLVATANAETRAALRRTGAVAVIAAPALHAAIVASLSDVGAVATSADALDAPIAVLDPTSAKGLEFDHVIVVEPSAMVSADRAGLRLLYVTITRTTKTLTIVHAEALPEGLAPRGD
jgi:hypothetical protein